MIELVRYHTFQKMGVHINSNVRVALVKEGRKWLQVIAIDTSGNGGLRVWRVPKSEHKYMKTLMRGSQVYPMKRALVTFRRFGKTHGITKGAMKILKEAANEQKKKKDTAGKAPAETPGNNA